MVFLLASSAGTAAVGATASVASSLHNKLVPRIDGLKAWPMVRLMASPALSFSLRTSRPLQISCAASPETLEKVVEIVSTQLAAKPGDVRPESKFSDLGADSLDQVEIVMALEEHFGITVDEEGAEALSTVQDAADTIEKLRVVEKAK
eukprot:c18670_g1_i1 orf=169-612(+)